MATTTIRPASSQRDGYTRSDDTVYATARSDTTPDVVNSTASTFITGQRYNSGTFLLWLAYMGFDLSSLNGKKITAVTVEYTTNSSSVSNASDIKILDYNTDGIIGSDDWYPGDTVAGWTVFGTIPSTNNGTTTTYQISLNASAVAQAQADADASDYFGVTLASADFINGTSPGTSDHRYTIRSSENATAAYRPALIVDYEDEWGDADIFGTVPTVSASGTVSSSSETSVVFNSTAADGTIYRGGTDWADARANTSLLVTDGVYVGYEVSGSYIDNGGLVFDTSSLPDDAIITSVTLSLYLYLDNSSVDFTIEVRAVDLGAAFGTPDFVDPDTLGSYPLVASLATSGVTSSYNDFSSETAFIAAINKTGNTTVYLHSDDERLDTDPGANAYVVFEDGSTGVPPKLTVVYTTGASGTGAVQAPAGSVDATGERVVSGLAGAVAVAPEAAASGERSVVGSGAISGTSPTVSAAGERAVVGGAAVSAPVPTTTGAIERIVTGTGAIEAPVGVVAGLGGRASQGVGSIAAPVPTLGGSGTVTSSTVTGSGAITASVPTLSGSGVRTVTGSGAISASTPTISGAGSVIGPVIGAGGVAAPVPALAGTGRRIVTGSGTVITPTTILNGSGVRVIVGLEAILAPVPTLVGAGTRTPSGIATRVARAEIAIGPRVSAILAVHPTTGADILIDPKVDGSPDTGHSST